MPIKEIKRTLSIYGMTAVELFDPARIRRAYEIVMATNLCIFKGNPFVRAHSVGMTPLHHKRARCNQGSHFGIIESMSQIPFGNFVFLRIRITYEVAFISRRH